MKWLRSVVCLVLLFPSIAFADDDPLHGVGPLMLGGRPAEARVQLLKAREIFASRGQAPQEARTLLLLGLVDTALEDVTAARRDLQLANEKLTASGDAFGAWMALWAIAILESQSGSQADAAAAYERMMAKAAELSAPDAQLSIDSLETLGGVFGANTEMLRPFAQFPELLRPIFLLFVNVTSHDSYAQFLIDAGDLDAAEDHLAKATVASQGFGGMFQASIPLHYAELRKQQWRLAEARPYYQKALRDAQFLGAMSAPNALVEELKVLRNAAELELLSGHLDDALAWNDRARKLVRDRKDVKREAGVLRTRGNLLQQGGRYDAALLIYDEALTLATANADRSRQADIHGDLGAAHMVRGTYGTAARHLEKAIALHQALKQPYSEAGEWMLLAEVYMLLDAESNAQFALENARKLAKDSDFKVASAMIDVLARTRDMHKGRGTPAGVDAALTAFLQMPDARSLMFTPGMEHIVRQSYNLAGIPPQGQIPLEAGAPAAFAAFALVGQASSAMIHGQYDLARDRCIRGLALNPSRDHKASLLGLMGISYWAEGNGSEALKYVKEAANTLESSAADVKVEELLTSYLGSNRRWYFDVLIDMLIAEKKPVEAFAQAERARARTFLQMVGNHRLNATTGDPKLVTEAENVRAAIAERERLAAMAAPEDAPRAAADLQRAREYYRTLLVRMKTTSPEYESVVSVEPRGMDEIRADLPPDTTLVSYYVTPRAIHAWVIDRASSHYEVQMLDQMPLKTLVCWADELSAATTRGVELPDRECLGNAATAEEAYRVLIAPLRPHIHNAKLMVVPHGVLHYVPFAALRDPESGHYLVQDYTISYAPSANAVRFLQAKETPVDGGALVLGDPVTPIPALPPLPGAKDEARVVARTLNTMPHLGADARETLLYGLNGRVDLVHLAAHALYDASNPLFSRIALATDEKNDGSLTVNEILSSVDLKGVNLVVLSTCRSAMGERSGGDEIVGLTRALLYAGTPGVLSTLWNIDDLSTTAFMTAFYRRLGNGVTAAEALRDAQVAAIEKGESPKRWAAFMLTGDPQGRWRSDRGGDSVSSGV